MKSAVLVFPGSNCDEDCVRAVDLVVGGEVDRVWHKDDDLSGYDFIVVPGGFSYGDYLRSGAIARFSPIVKSLEDAAARGVTILGVCNGFQILLEAGLLPGAMRVNQSLKFICKPSALRVEDSSTRFTGGYQKGEIIDIPVAHHEGNYYCDEEALRRLEDNGQVVFRYVDNPNGSVADIAGIRNKAGNILGMMPHPERAVRDELGSSDGIRLFESVARYALEEKKEHA
jgi:phosphoribosylformylglycinamidine synthase